VSTLRHMFLGHVHPGGQCSLYYICASSTTPCTTLGISSVRVPSKTLASDSDILLLGHSKWSILPETTALEVH